ncbi:Protein ECM30 [Nakaseomyces glabratus]|uniref:Protein ECM30 n=1 Tax=Candida glabrata TaxID=5478 RepID=A0A0W0D8G3_CANGB|nr:Protein ECM30 [Nakaseomyces glabratus]KTB06398.1 Protein ECM30 [Nakaseomyces glabratus]KTB08075.1 Protein ECM30 [Nakaseomyces glabratus]KTB14256.1 Protein ECM30 [Nakaseomyces glabratus]
MGNTDSKLNSLYKEHLLKLARPEITSIDNSQNGVICLFNPEYSLREIIDLYNNRGNITPDKSLKHTSDNHNTSIEDNLFTDYYKNFLKFDFQKIDNFNDLISKDELRTIYKNNKENYLNLIRFVILKIILIPSMFGNTQNKSSFNKLFKQLLTCIKILTKLVPVYLENIVNGEKDILWDTSPDALFGEHIPDTDLIPVSMTSALKTSLDMPTADLASPHMERPLGAALLDSCLNLLFIEDFTVSSSSDTSQKTGDLTMILWENGINTYDTSYYTQFVHLDANRLQIIELLLALVSIDIYLPVNSDGFKAKDKIKNKYLDYMKYEAREHSVICLTASIINLFCRHSAYYKQEGTNPYKIIPKENSRENPKYSNRNSFDTNPGSSNNINSQWLPELRSKLVISSLQFLNVMICPEESNTKVTKKRMVNTAVSYLATLQREFDLKLILTSVIRIFKLPIDAAIDEDSNLFTFPTASSRKKHQNLSNHSRTSSSSNIKRSTSNSSATSRYDSNPNTVTGSPKLANMRENNTSSYSSLPPLPPILCQSLVFLINVIKINKLVKNQFADKFASKFVVFAVYYLKYYNDNPEYSLTVIPVINMLALYLTSKPLVLLKMLDPFNSNYYTNKIPNAFKLTSGNINNLTYRDFTVIQLCNIADYEVKNNIQPNPIIYETLYNLIPIDPKWLASDTSGADDEELTLLSRKKSINSSGNGLKSCERLSYNASLAVLHLISKMSSRNYLTTYSTPRIASMVTSIPAYVLSPGFKLDLLAILLRAVSLYVVSNTDEAMNLIFAFARHKSVILQLSEVMNSIAKNFSPTNTQISTTDKNIRLRDFYRLHDLSYNNINFRKAFNNDEGFHRSSSPNLIKSNNGKNNDNNDSDNDSMDMNSSAYLVLTKPIAREYSSDDLRNNNLTTREHAGSNNNNNNINSSNDKTLQVLEYVDFINDPIISLANESDYFKMRPKWPVGISMKSKVKSSMKKDFVRSWQGNDSMVLLVKIVKVLLYDFPEIATINNSEYYVLLKKMEESKDHFLSMIKDNIPIYMRTGSSIQHQKLSIDDESKFSTIWFYTLCWSDIFNTHSSPYNKSLINELEEVEETNDIIPTISNNGSNIFADPGSPVLERWNSNSSNLSRTNSNSSSLMGYFFQQPQSASSNRSSVDHTSRFIESKNASAPTKKASAPQNSSFSLFKFSWTGFNKNGNSDDCDVIKEEEETTVSQTSTRNGVNQQIFVNALDMSLLKSNIWVDTKVRMFIVEREEKEEFSLLDMTSTFFKKLKFNNSAAMSNWESNNIPGSTPLASVPFAARNPMF